MGNGFVIQPVAIFHNEAELILRINLLDLRIKQAVSIRITSIRHVRNEFFHLRFVISYVFIMDIIASNFESCRSIIINRIFLNIITFLAIIFDDRLIRIIQEMNDSKGCSTIILEASGFTVIRSRHPDIIVFLLFIVQGVRNEIDLTVFNLECIGILRARFIIRKGIFQHTPGIFIIGDNRADKFARLRIFMKFKRVFFLFIRRSIVHIINLDLDIDTIRKRRVSSIGHDKMDNVFILDFVVQNAVLSHLDNAIDIRKRLVIIRSDF